MRMNNKYNFVNCCYLPWVSFCCEYFIILEYVIIIVGNIKKLTGAQTIT